MSNDIPTIHDFDFDLICDYFSNLERQGPGSPEATLRALDFIAPLTAESKIADIGCGTGGQTLVLAQHSPATITGIDLFPAFIDLFNQNAKDHNLQDRMMGRVGSMDHLDFQEEELDVIWSEGAIYNIGFQRGLQEWWKFLKPGGSIAVTEASWFTENPPGEIEAFWRAAYPEIDTIPNKIAQLQAAGYRLTAVFCLPEICWTEHFYAPQTVLQEQYLQQHPDNPAVQHFIESERHEAELYQRYKAHYGYVFYIGQKQ